MTQPTLLDSLVIKMEWAAVALQIDRPDLLEDLIAKQAFHHLVTCTTILIVGYLLFEWDIRRNLARNKTPLLGTPAWLGMALFAAMIPEFIDLTIWGAIFGDPYPYLASSLMKSGNPPSHPEAHLLSEHMQMLFRAAAIEGAGSIAGRTLATNAATLCAAVYLLHAVTIGENKFIPRWAPRWLLLGIGFLIISIADLSQRSTWDALNGSPEQYLHLYKGHLQ